MNSGFVHPPQSTGLSDSSIQANLVANDSGSLRIIGRNPKSGNPARGIPFSIDVEINISKSFSNSLAGLTCPDVTVIALDPQWNTVYGFVNIEPAALQGCVGTGKIIFNTDFVPNATSPVQLKAFYNKNFKQSASELVSSGKAIMSSKVMAMNMDEETGRNAGIYATAEDPWYDIDYTPDSALFGINQTMKRVITIAGIGAGIYFAAPFFPMIKRGIKTIAKKSNA